MTIVRHPQGEVAELILGVEVCRPGEGSVEDEWMSLEGTDEVARVAVECVEAVGSEEEVPHLLPQRHRLALPEGDPCRQVHLRDHPVQTRDEGEGVAVGGDQSSTTEECRPPVGEHPHIPLDQVRVGRDIGVKPMCRVAEEGEDLKILHRRVLHIEAILLHIPQSSHRIGEEALYLTVLVLVEAVVEVLHLILHRRPRHTAQVLPESLQLRQHLLRKDPVVPLRGVGIVELLHRHMELLPQPSQGGETTLRQLRVEPHDLALMPSSAHQQCG